MTTYLSYSSLDYVVQDLAPPLYEWGETNSIRPIIQQSVGYEVLNRGCVCICVCVGGGGGGGGVVVF